MRRDGEGLRVGTSQAGKRLLAKEQDPTTRDGAGMPVARRGLCAWEPAAPSSHHCWQRPKEG